MSNAWKTGDHGAQWRRVRLFVLERDNYVCQICHTPIPRNARKPDPMSPEVHHTGARRITGDDPAHLVAAHRRCNLRIGDPTNGDPPAKVGDWW